jgi:hypothetical protein
MPKPRDKRARLLEEGKRLYNQPVEEILRPVGGK